jgi:hypothetical protein
VCAARGVRILAHHPLLRHIIDFHTENLLTIVYVLSQHGSVVMMQIGVNYV